MDQCVGNPIPVPNGTDFMGCRRPRKLSVSPGSTSRQQEDLLKAGREEISGRRYIVVVDHTGSSSGYNHSWSRDRISSSEDAYRQLDRVLA
jgi:hypothetical protein